MRTALVILIVFLPFIFCAQQGKEYEDGHGKKVFIPLGDMAFADSLVSYTAGDPAPLEKCRNGKLALGTPDYDGADNNFTVLGTNGELVLYFKDNALVNVPGADLYIFELGKYVEETFLSVSKDGKKWIPVGKIGGGNAVVDLGDSIPSYEVFRYVMLKDAGTMKNKADNYIGADIDAVAAVGSARSISLNATLLFNVNKFDLKPAAKKILDTIAETLNKYPDFQVRIEGHTDSTGQKVKNQKLSIDRANSVKTYLLSKLKNKSTPFTTQGYADDIPVATNTTPEGREANRRVEIFLIPLSKKN